MHDLREGYRLFETGAGTTKRSRPRNFPGWASHYDGAKARKNYAGTSPITRASGKSRSVLARHVRNRRLADALYLQAFAALKASPGARSYYNARRARGATHHQALRAVGNRLVGILHGCLRHHRRYDETFAWLHSQDQIPAAA